MSEFYYGSVIDFRPEKLSEDEINRIYLSGSIRGCGGFVLCSDPYWRRYDPRNYFYFAFPSLPLWIDKVIEHFNSTMNNMKVEVYGLDKIVNGFKAPVFLLTYSDKYPISFRKYSSLIVHHYFRSFSIGEAHCSFSRKLLKLPELPRKTNIAKLACFINNNSNDKYRFLHKSGINNKDILRFDDLEIIKNIYIRYGNVGGVYKQTSIIDLLREHDEKYSNDMKRKYNIDVGAYVTTKDNLNDKVNEQVKDIILATVKSISGETANLSTILHENFMYERKNFYTVPLKYLRTVDYKEYEDFIEKTKHLKHTDIYAISLRKINRVGSRVPNVKFILLKNPYGISETMPEITRNTNYYASNTCT